MRVFVAASAEADVQSIKDYFETRNPRAADAMLRRAATAAELLGRHPLIGREGRLAGTREFVITRTPLVLVYVLADDALTVVRVLHAQRQWPP